MWCRLQELGGGQVRCIGENVALSSRALVFIIFSFSSPYIPRCHLVGTAGACQCFQTNRPGLSSGNHLTSNQLLCTSLLYGV